ncbi:MAG: hypothetical protein KDC34_03520 [Saprospiraceae bacterium]|nr:hypothetical protein [Saprospiraceae bacterium]
MAAWRINAWSSPRNISTALMYSFAQRPDTVVVDEPLYAHYLSHTSSGTIHPGRENILASQSSDGKVVVQKVLQGEYESPIVFFKQMTHHLIDIDRAFLDQMENIVLIRDPRLILHSYSKVIDNPGMQDIGIEMQYALFRELQAKGRQPAVVDANELLKNPEKVLQELCRELLIPWFPEMLKWKKGQRPEDGVWAPYWYENVHQSTGFQPFKERQFELNENLKPLAIQAEKYYSFLFDFAIKADN